ncbi:type IV secretion system protein [Bartonella sp. CB169]|uniref:type IV secretion system protein n=1 Tax=Bartonella sp. CB169 TaxID=3112257 RepID=UPI00300DD095
MKKILLATALCAISLGLETSAFAIMPTFDAAAVGKMIDQLKQGKQQLDQLKGQINEMKKLYDSLNGAVDLSALQELLNRQGNNTALPSDFSHLEQSIGSSGVGSSGSSGKTAKWEEKLLYKEPASGAGSKAAVDAFYQQEVQKTQQRNVGQAALGQSVYEETNETVEAIQKIVEKLQNAQTAADVQSAQAQLAATQTLLQAKAIQMQAVAMIQKAQAEAEKIRTRQEFNARYKNYASQLLGK